jgi:hypothetical protein
MRATVIPLFEEVLAGTLDLSPVSGCGVGLDGAPDGYAAMNEWKALKALVRPAQGSR